MTHARAHLRARHHNGLAVDILGGKLGHGEQAWSGGGKGRVEQKHERGRGGSGARGARGNEAAARTKARALLRAIEVEKCFKGRRARALRARRPS